MRRAPWIIFTLALVPACAQGDLPGTSIGPNGGSAGDAASESSTGGTGGAGVDAGTDAKPDAAADVVSDTTVDVMSDAPDDAGADALADASMDALTDVIPEAAPDVAPDGPPGPCDGVTVGGYCWYWGEEEASCDQECSAHGGYHAATKDYAGSSGTNAHCEAVLDALGVPGAGTLTTLSGSGEGVGCFFMNLADARHRVADVPTSPSATYMLARRACACQQ